MVIFKLKRKYIILILIFFAVGCFIWQERSKSLRMVHILDSIPNIEKIFVKDNHTNDLLLEFDENHTGFNHLRDSTYKNFYELNWQEKLELSKINPLYRIEYYEGNEEKFPVHVYLLDDQQVSIVPSDEKTEVTTISFNYSADNQSPYYVLIVEELNQAINFSTEMEQVIDSLEDLQN